MGVGRFRIWNLSIAAALVFAVCALPATIQAAALERSAADGLVYIRLHSLPADLPTEVAGPKHATILDLRYTKTDAASATVLSGWIKFHADRRTPVLILVNGSTAPALLARLQDRDSVPGLLTIGVASEQFVPDLTVTTTAREEQRAYEALESGTTIAALTTDHPHKQRNDEASLAHNQESPPSTDADENNDTEHPAAKPKSQSIIDAALQRAIDVYLGLKAMKAA